MKKNRNETIVSIPKELQIIIETIKEKRVLLSSEHREFFEGIDWNKFIKLCVDHGTVSIVYKKLKSLVPVIIPEKTFSGLKDLYEQIVRWNIFQSKELIKILKILDENGIRAIPIKGPVVSVQAYGDIGFRMSQDLDLIIESGNFIKLYDVLSEQGYQPSGALSEKKKKLWKRYKRDIEFRRNKTIIDVHQRISQAHAAFDVRKGHFACDHFVEILGQKVPVLSAEETLIYLMINSAKDGWSSLRMIADLSFLIHSNPDINWRMLIKRSKKMGILRMVLTGLHLMSDITGEALPEIMNLMIKKDKKILKLSDNYKNNLLFKSFWSIIPDRVRTISENLDSPIHKLRYLLYFIFTPTPEDFRAVRLPGLFYFLYRLIRPIRLIILALGSKNSGARSQDN